ncbi:YdbC family protein [Ornithinibacillus contaminans]|uniref:YdbC family protein n=1 Tax=Ornithinibacillus contaminans TaxID=694055 RepID=UPI00064DFB7A|nr:PC4/YdbC family ssDNA-binding protein [Ornithinibacillus contaminans]
MSDLKYEILDKVAVLSESGKGWKKEFNVISWNGREPKYDIRDWSPDREKMGKGITLTIDELKELKAALNELDELL